MEFVTALGGAAGGALLSVAFERLFDKLELGGSQNLEKQILVKLQNWRRSLLPKIHALLEDAEEKQMSNSGKLVKIWLSETRDLAYDMEDILNEFQVDSQRRSLNIIAPDQASTNSFIRSFFKRFKPSEPSGSLISDPQTISKVDDITLRLQRLVDESKTLGLITQAGGKPSGMVTERLPTTSLPERHVCGRQTEKEAILQSLLNDEGGSKGFCVIPILGMGGIGKTTLAQLVYNEVKPESFELKCWVCVSDQFVITSITRTILKAVGGKCVSNDLNLLQQELNSKLSSKKFLLVLDDIWNEDRFLWDSLQKPFFSGAAGSKIIITTRNERVVEIMQGVNRVFRLDALTDEECLSVFAQQALGTDNLDAHPHLKDIGEQIVKRCRGLPLAAKALGGLLCGKSSHPAWEHILKSEIWELQETGSNILPALRLSYHYLPPYLKPCFAYCALFPKDHEFEKIQLVSLWMACGVLQQQSVEAGDRYFLELVSRAFFQRSSRNESRYVMHDLIHDLAQFVAGESCFNLEYMLEVDKKSKVNFGKVRHLSFISGQYDISKKFKVLNLMKCLRTFIPVGSLGSCHLSNIVVHDWLPKLRCLRALSLEDYQIKKLPDSIGDLIHLKYLNLSGTPIESLPESMGSLTQLQTLLLFDCRQLLKFPTTIGNLTDICHLDIRGTDSLKEMPLGLGNLKNLLTLSKFIVGKEDGLIRLSNLKNFSQLGGNLSILNLQNVLNVRDAMEANLKNIDGLDELLLEWTSDFGDSRNESNRDMQVLNWLKPHSNLKSLTVVSYGGQNFPPWIGDPIFSTLSYLELKDCKRCTLLPSLGELPVLKSLIIEGMEGVEAVGSKFYGYGTFSSLEKLVFRDMHNWKKWTSPTGSGGEFSRLVELEIRNCPKLTGQLPGRLSSLVNLVIEGCPELRCSSTMSLVSLKKLHIRDCNVILLRSMVDLTSLNRLRIENISELSCLPKCFTQFLTALKNLEIRHCKELTCLWEDGLETVDLTALESLEINSCQELTCLWKYRSEIANLAHLERMEIRSCLLLVSLTGKEQGLLPLNLKHLTLDSCKNLEFLPDGILMQDDGDNNSNLEILYLTNLPSLNSFQRGQLPVSLKEFHVDSCDGLESFPKGMLQHCTRLQSISIESCRRLKSLPCLDCLNNLVDLSIHDCKGLESIPDLGLCIPNLKQLTVRGCENLKQLIISNCENLKQLTIRNCENLKQLTMSDCENLKHLTMDNCKNLKSFPNTLMAQLKLLQILLIRDCPSIELIPVGTGNGNGGLLLPPNLAWLMVDDSILKFLQVNPVVPDGDLATMVGWDLHTLTSLQHLSIRKIFPPNILLPPSLTSLSISQVENLELIPRELLQNLHSLQRLRFWECLNLRSLPKEGLPPSLGELEIADCPFLKRQRFEAKGDHLHFTHIIPYVLIDDHQVFP